MPKASIVMFSGDLDKSLASFIIANGAAAAGWDVTIFFTFWGINLLRDPAKHASKPKTTIEKMMGMMMPNGPDAPKISKMNMLGIGTSMIKGRMRGLKVKPLADMMKDAKELGVKFLICDLSMDIMGLQKEEFSGIVDDFVGVGTYISESENANITLFI
jgi:peroxiredoxin family protein